MSYAFDPLGTNPANRVLNEVHTVTTVNGTNNPYHFLDAAPFFGDSVSIVNKSTGDFLVPGVDFVFGHKYEEASYQTGRDIYGSIVFTDPSRTGSYAHEYRTLGGPTVLAENSTLADGLGILAELQSIRWENIANVPDVFPPGPHNLPTTDIEGYQQLLVMFDRLVATFEEGPKGLSLADVTDLDSTLVTPMLEALAEVSAAIQASSFMRDTEYVTYDSSTLPTVRVSNPTLGVWTPTGIEMVIPTAGTWEVDIRPHYEITWATTNIGKVAIRWVVGGLPVAQSMAKHFVRGFTQNSRLSLQVRITDASVDQIDFKSSNGETNIIAKKIVS